MNSLRGRLWLGYALLAGVLLVVVFLGLLASIQRNALFYPQALAQVRVVERRLIVPLNTLQNSSERLAALNMVARSSSERLVWLSDEGDLLFDSGAGKMGALGLRRLVSEETPAQVGVMLDRQEKMWIYSLQPLEDGSFLLVLTPRPNLALRALVRNEIITPLVWAAMIALALALVLSLTLGKWITRPLQDLVEGAQRVAQGEYPQVVASGPREVQQLAVAFNQMSRKVQAGQQSQRDFLANVTHELKTPLTSIQGFAQAVLDGTVQTPQQVQEAAQVMHQEAERMNRLVLELLVLARLESGTAEMRRQPVVVADLLAQVGQKFSLQAQAGQVQIELMVSDLPDLMGDWDRLVQVFSNLLDNALRYTPPGGRVLLVAEQQTQGWLLVQVVDGGPGIAPEEQERIFERFYQADRSRRGGRSGVGLGLPIARQICRAHGGDLTVSSSPGQGCTFVVKLPFQQACDRGKKS